MELFDNLTLYRVMDKSNTPLHEVTATYYYINRKCKKLSTKDVYGRNKSHYRYVWYQDHMFNDRIIMFKLKILRGGKIIRGKEMRTYINEEKER